MWFYLSTYDPVSVLIYKRVYLSGIIDQSNTAHQPHKLAFFIRDSSARGGVPLVWGDGCCDGFLAVGIFSKKRLKVLETRRFVKFIDIVINEPCVQTHSLAKKLNYLREPWWILWSANFTACRVAKPPPVAFTLPRPSLVQAFGVLSLWVNRLEPGGCDSRDGSGGEVYRQEGSRFWEAILPGEGGVIFVTCDR